MVTKGRVTSVGISARRRWLSALAPVVDGFTGLRTAHGFTGQDSTVLRLSTRKVLAIDGGVRSPLLTASLPGAYAALNLPIGLGRLISGDLVNGTVHATVAALVFVLAMLIGSWAAARRLARLTNILARCVFVPSRLIKTDLSSSMDRSGFTTHTLTLFVDYVYAGARRQTSLAYVPSADNFVGATPALLVDTADPQHVFLRDLYV